jgi:hypothetical protein
VSDTDVLKGWCYVCNTSIEADVQAHFDQEHPAAPTAKPRVPMLSWEHRLRNVRGDVDELLEETDPTRLIAIIDGVLQELYLVRARLSQMKRNKEGINNGRS